jgi:hypothetical protein
VLAAALTNNSTLLELDVSSNSLSWSDYVNGSSQRDSSGVIALANAIPDMGAISQFTFSGDSGESKPVTMETSMVEADFSGKHLGVSGAIMLSAFLPKCM